MEAMRFKREEDRIKRLEDAEVSRLLISREETMKKDSLKL